MLSYVNTKSDVTVAMKFIRLGTNKIVYISDMRTKNSLYFQVYRCTAPMVGGDIFLNLF